MMNLRTVAIGASLAAILGVSPARSQDPEAAVAKTAPAFSLENALTGQSVTLNAFAGKVVLLKFWRWGCPYSRAAIAYTEKTHRNAAYAARGLSVISINTKESKEDILKFRDRWAAMPESNATLISYPILVGTGSSAGRDYDIKGVPTFVVVGRDGTIAWQDSGYDDTVDAVVNAEIEKALAK
ncbi:MAG: redoxin family protein [Elusimicrobia bacterium]|nr:redoxin family protein [Elusimicrobiota bacterium]